MGLSKKGLIIILCCLVAAAGILTGVILLNNPYKNLKMDETAEGTIILADNASEDSANVLFITIADGKGVPVEAALEGDSRMEIKVYPMEINKDTSPVKVYNLDKTHAEDTIDLPDGNYTLEVYASRGAAGKLLIKNR